MLLKLETRSCTHSIPSLGLYLAMTPLSSTDRLGLEEPYLQKPRPSELMIAVVTKLLEVCVGFIVELNPLVSVPILILAFGLMTYE